MICLLLLFAVPEITTAQNYPLREYTVLDGLPQTQARTLFQDSRGFLWIVTRNGISRFDGVEFRNYFRRDGLPSNIIFAIIEDENGFIWALSQDGMSRYDGYGFEFFPYVQKSESELFGIPNRIKDTIILALHNIETNRYRLIGFRDGNYFDRPLKNPILDTMNISHVCYDEYSRSLFLTEPPETFSKFQNGKLVRLPDLKIAGINYDRGKTVFFGPPGNYFELSDGRLVPKQYVNPDGQLEIKEILPGVTDSLKIFKDGFITKIKTPTIAAAYIDSESNIWLGSEANFYKVVSLAFSFLGKEHGLPNNTWAIAEDRNGHIWFGTLSGDLLEFDGQKLIQRNDYEKLFGPDPAFFKGSIRRADGDVFFSLNRGVLVWDGNRFSRLPGIPDGAQVCIIYEDPDDKSLLFGTGVGLFHLKNGEMKFFPEFTPNGFGIIEGIVKDDENGYWLSGEKGMVHFDGRNSVPLKDSLMPQGYTYTLVKDNRGGLWITSDEGLFFKGKSSKRLSYGLPEEKNVSANSIIVMDSTHIMVGRMSDICIIDITRFYSNDPDYFKIYDSSYGFTGNNCLDNGIIKDRNGKYWIMSSGLVSILDTRKLSPNKIPPRINLTDVEFETDSMTWVTLRIPDLFYNKAGEIKISHKQNNLRFRFTGISTTNPENVTYQYRLAGHKDIWSGKSKAREAVYQDISPGNYEFQLKAFNADGVETPEIYSLKFNIVPAFWQTLVFKITAIVSLLIATILLTWRTARFYAKRKNEEIQLKNELKWLQINSSLRQFDPHFTFNLIASVGSLILRDRKETAYDYILKLSALLRAMLSDGTVMVRPLYSEIDFVKKYSELQELRFKERLKCKFQIDDRLNIYRLIPKMTIQTFVENSIKHGIENKIEGGQVNVSVKETYGHLEIIVTDNGVGRKAAQSLNTRGSGYGLKTINAVFDFLNRLNRDKAKIEITDLSDNLNNPAGTEVRITIPDNFIFELTGEIKDPAK